MPHSTNVAWRLNCQRIPSTTLNINFSNCMQGGQSPVLGSSHLLSAVTYSPASSRQLDFVRRSGGATVWHFSAVKWRVPTEDKHQTSQHVPRTICDRVGMDHGAVLKVGGTTTRICRSHRMYLSLDESWQIVCGASAGQGEKACPAACFHAFLGVPSFEACPFRAVVLHPRTLDERLILYPTARRIDSFPHAPRDLDCNGLLARPELVPGSGE